MKLPYNNFKMKLLLLLFIELSELRLRHMQLLMTILI